VSTDREMARLLVPKKRKIREEINDCSPEIEQAQLKFGKCVVSAVPTVRSLT
jgi:hypothetical protein